MRFQMKKGTKGWMAWDNHTSKVAVLDGLPASNLSAETDRQFADSLNKLDKQITQLRRDPQSLNSHWHVTRIDSS